MKKKYIYLLLLLFLMIVTLNIIHNRKIRTFKVSGITLNQLELTKDSNVKTIILKDLSNEAVEKEEVGSSDIRVIMEVLSNLEYSQITVYETDKKNNFDEFLYSLDIVTMESKYSLIVTDKEIIRTDLIENSEVIMVQLAIDIEQNKVLLSTLSEILNN